MRITQKNWCQQMLACDALGQEVDVNDPAAVKRCAGFYRPFEQEFGLRLPPRPFKKGKS